MLFSAIRAAPEDLPKQLHHHQKSVGSSCGPDPMLSNLCGAVHASKSFSTEIIILILLTEK